MFSAFIAIANELLDKCNLPGKISRLEECSDNFFVGVYRGLLGDDLPGRVNNILTCFIKVSNSRVCSTFANGTLGVMLNKFAYKF